MISRFKLHGPILEKWTQCPQNGFDHYKVLLVVLVSQFSVRFDL